jgi:hypothetical protein
VLPSLPPQPDAEGSHTFREGRLGLGLLWDAVCDRSWLVPCVFVFVCVLLCLISRNFEQTVGDSSLVRYAGGEGTETAAL